ncbi:MAG: YkvA family protein [Symbiobacteriia bacterium]
MNDSRDNPERDNAQDNRLLTPELKDAFMRLPRYARLAWALARDPAVPPSAKAVLAGGVLYVVSPIDLVPGFVPVLGQLDDLLVLLTTVRYTLRSLDPIRAAVLLEEVGVSREDVDADRKAFAQAMRVTAREAWRLGKAGARVATRAVGGAAIFAVVLAGHAGLATARLAGRAGNALWRAARDRRQ